MILGNATRICRFCGKEFVPYRPKSARQITCSRSCGSRLTHERRKLAGYSEKPIADRFWPKVEKTNSCWLWCGATGAWGYGNIGARKEDGKLSTLRAHRVSWEIHYGPVPYGLLVLHKCDNRVCVNPDHLFLGNYMDNMNDMIEKGRSRKGERHHAAKLTDNDVLAIRADERALSEIAGDYPVHKATISAIKNGKLWGHVK